MPPVEGEYFSNLTPVTGQALCEVASSSKKDVDLALDAAHAAKDAWGKPQYSNALACCLRLLTAWSKI